MMLKCACVPVQPAILTNVPSSCQMVSSSSVASTGRRMQADGSMMNSSHHITLSSQVVHWGYF